MKMNVLNFLGLLDEVDVNEKRQNRLKRYVAVSGSAVLLLPSLTAFLMNLNDVERALEALYFFAIQLFVYAQFMSIITDLKRFNEMWNQMRSHVVLRTANDHGESYSRLDKLFKLCNNWFSILFSTTAAFVLIPPLIITILKYYKLPAMETDSWNFPFLLWFPFSTTNPLAYAFVYLISVFNLLSNMVCKLAVQEVFFRTGFHFIASCHDIRDSLSRVNTLYDRRDNGNKYTERSSISYEVKLQMKDIIKYHGEMNNLFESFSAVISGIVFFEYSINTVLLGAVGVFVAQDSDILNTEGTMLKFKFVCCSGIASLLITSMLGSELSHQKSAIANYFYLSNWYAWPIEVQKFIPMALLLGQKRSSIYGFGVILCDLTTFKEAINKIISFIILLKQMK